MHAGFNCMLCFHSNQVEKAIFSFHHSAFSLQLSTFSFQPSAFSLQLPAFSFQPSASSLQISVFSSQSSAFSHQPFHRTNFSYRPTRVTYRSSLPELKKSFGRFWSEWSACTALGCWHKHKVATINGTFFSFFFFLSLSLPAHC